MKCGWRVLAAVALAAALLVPATASAAVRYAEPGVGGSDPACPQSDPCDLEEAVEMAAAGDEVVIQTGTYSMSNPLSVGGSGTVVHGEVGKPRPVLETSGFTGVGSSNAAATLRWLEIRHTGTGPSLNLGGTAERVIVRALSPSTDRACRINFFAELRDSVCAAPVGAVPALHALEGGGFSRTLRVRNVTAVSAGSFGLLADANTDTSLTVDVKSSILRGGAGTDVRAQKDASTATATVTLANSNFATTSATAGGSVTAPGTAGNQTGAPLFVDAAAGDFRQTAASPTRNAGVVDAESGTIDFEGEPRSQESAPDIGADEYDVIAPSVAIVSGPSEGETIATRETSFGFSSDDFAASFACEVDGAGFGPCSGPGNTHSVTGLPNGAHSFSVRATDTNGLVGVATRNFGVSVPGSGGDTDPPETTITKSPPNKTKKEAAKFKFRSDEPGSSFECKLDKKPFKPCTSPRSYRRLDEEKHRFSVRATDAAGNTDLSAAKDKWKVL